MIEPTDASKCDERQVKKKANTLTKKKKGERHIMSIQGMKTWKLGAFFVINLMLVAGLFTNTAPAHDPDGDGDKDATSKLATVTVTPGSVTAEGMVDLEVRYTAEGTLANVDADSPSYGRIRVMLPGGWGPSDAMSIYKARVSGDRTATYLSLSKSSGVKLAADSLIVGGEQSTGYTIDIDVDKMTNRHYIELTIHNLMIGTLADVRGTDPSTRYMDIATAAEFHQVQVFADQYTDSTRGVPKSNGAHAARTFRPEGERNEDDAADLVNHHPTVKVNRKELGELTISPNKVTAGSMQDFTFTYKATEELMALDVIEIRLPAWDAMPMADDGMADPDIDPPTPFNFNTENKLVDADGTLLKDAKGPHIYLSGSTSRLQGAVISLIGGDGSDAPDTTGNNGDKGNMGWIVRIVLGDRGVPMNGTIVLKYENVTVQRAVAGGDDKLKIETFSGPSASAVKANVDLPQFPVKAMKDDTIEVTRAADGSGMITFTYTSSSGDVDVTADGTALVSNTIMSIPAGLTKADLMDLIVTYKPDGDMGAGELEFRLPSGWAAEEVRVNGDDSSAVSGNTVTVDFFDYFGEGSNEDVEITFVDITVPKEHGVVNFVAKSKSEGGSLKQLMSRPMAFVGNTLADHDAVKVEITPAAAYEGEENVDFEITLTTNGPMYDSEIQITVPVGLTDLQDEDRTGSNYVRLVSTTATSTRLTVLDVRAEDIIVMTGKLGAGGRVVVRIENVDIVKDKVSTDESDGFRVGTKTRVDGDAMEGMDYADLNTLTYYEPIEKADGNRSIVGGLIRTIAGSGMMAISPSTIEQGSGNRNIELTFTATADFEKLNLVITAPEVIETELQEDRSSNDGHVSTPHTSKLHEDDPQNDLVITSREIKWGMLTLRKGERFTTNIRRVDLLDNFTGNFRWEVTLDGTAIPDADNPEMVVVGTMADDVAFEIVDSADSSVYNPSYPAASEQLIRFRFTTENTAIQPGGTLRFSVPGRWTMPSLTDREGKATVSIVSEDDDGNEIFVSELSTMRLSVSGTSVTLTIDAGGGLAKGDTVTIQYGNANFPVEIPSSVAGTSGSDVDGLAIHGLYRVSGETGFRQRSAGTVWVDVTNVEDGTGTVTVTPPSVRASSTDNLIRITYTAIGTMDGGAVQLIIPDEWGAVQSADAAKPNYITATVSSSATLADFEVLDYGITVQANLTTLGAGDNVMFTYGGGAGANRGAVAQAEIGEATFIVESRGSSGGDFMPITDEASLKALTIDVKGAASGSGTATVSIEKNKSGEVVYDSATGAEQRIFAGDDKTYLLFTYTAEQSIAEGELEFIVPMGWTAPQQGDTNQAGYTYIEQGNALVSDEGYNGQSVTATVQMERGDAVKVHYGWYAGENGGAHAPSAAGTYVFEVKFDDTAIDSSPSVIVHGGTASKLMVTAPSSVSADAGATPAAITVEIQDDTDAAAVLDSDLAVTLSSTSSTGSFADADGAAIVNNMVTISAGMTNATAYYSDTGAGTTATIRATVVGLDSGRADIEVTSDVDRVDANSIAVSSATAKADDTVTVTASGTAGKTATFSVGAIVTTMTMTESPAGSGSYSGGFTVVQDQHDGTHDVTVNIGDASDTVANAVTVDTNAPTISSAEASPATVENGDMVTITAMATGATSVTADVSALDTTQTTVTLAMANGAYSVDVTVSDSNAAGNGEKTITVTAMDAVGNSATATATVTLDNKLSYTSMIPSGTSLFHVPLDVDGLDTVGDLKAALGATVSLAIVYDSAAGSWNSRSDAVMITDDLGIILTTTAAITHTFEGQPWGNGISTINLKAGSNLIGLPVNDPRVTNVSDIMTLFATGIVTSIVVSTDGGFAAVSAAGAASDVPVMGDAAYLVTATADATAAVTGTGWSHAAMNAAPVALTGYSVDGQTPVLDVQGAVVDEITGLAKEGFRVKVKNLSTKASLSKVTSVEMAEGYTMTFVDLKAGNAARIGDVLEISADSPNPLIGVQPVRHIVTVDDVKNSTIQLEALIAYEIPAETELLRNYPNPFNPETWIPYHLAQDADVKLTIYDVNGAVVRDIDVGHQTAAKYDTRTKAIYWDGRNQFGEQVASGIYFYSLSAGDFSATRKMVILK